MAQQLLGGSMVAARRRPGRPAIGPKAQMRVPQYIWDEVAKEAKEREVPEAEVWRDIIGIGWIHWRGEA